MLVDVDIPYVYALELLFSFRHAITASAVFAFYCPLTTLNNCKTNFPEFRDVLLFSRN